MCVCVCWREGGREEVCLGRGKREGMSVSMCLYVCVCVCVCVCVEGRDNQCIYLCIRRMNT